MGNIIKITQDVGRSCRFCVFPNNPHSRSLLHKAWEPFIEYLAHSSFKDFAPANCFYWGINYEFQSSKCSVPKLRVFRCLISLLFPCHKWRVCQMIRLQDWRCYEIYIYIYTVHYCCWFCHYSHKSLLLQLFLKTFMNMSAIYLDFLKYHVLPYGLIKKWTSYRVNGCINITLDSYSFIHPFTHTNGNKAVA